MADTTLATNWVTESLRRIAQEKEKKAADDARAQSRAYNNLVESMQLILGVEHTERILSAHEPTTSPARIRSGRFEFEGRADACGTGFYIACPDYAGAYKYESGLRSGWIDSIPDLDKAIDELTAEMQKRDEFVAARIEREAIKVRPVPQTRELTPDEHYLVSHWRGLIKGIEDGDPLAFYAQANIHLTLALQSIKNMMGEYQGEPDVEPPDDYDPDGNR